MSLSRIAYLEYATKHKRPFIAYRLPNSNNHCTLIVDEDNCIPFKSFKEIKNQSGFVFSPFDTTENASFLITPKNIFYGDQGFDVKMLGTKIMKDDNILLANYDESENHYKKMFAEMHAQLKKGVLDKVILSRTITIPLPENFNTISLYNYTALKYTKAMVYHVYLPHLGINWIGATPETLLSQSGTDLHTMALAGTKKSNEVWTDKEKQEHKIVTDYIQNTLKGIKYTKSELQTISAGSVDHLATYFILRDSVNQLTELIDKIHPTPAIAGFPKYKALKLIRNVEIHNRDYYCGILGLWNMNEETHLFVNLRCLQIASEAVRLFVGGGLTKDSKVEKEWQETERKADTLREVLEK